MDKKLLEVQAIDRFGEETGRKILEAMIKLQNIDFCAALAWSENEVSISRSCGYRGKIFVFTSDYQGLIMPDKRIVQIKDLSYPDLVKYLPNKSLPEGQKHCGFDSPEMPEENF